MRRALMEKLKEWKVSANRKPLIIRGARQVGKTWLMKEFGKSEFQETVYLNFDGNRELTRLFEDNLDVRRIVAGLEIFSGKRIEAEKTLLIFDEIQEAPRALTVLKYF